MYSDNFFTKEYDLHLAICNYISCYYPDVIFTSDLSGIKMSIGQALKIKNLKSSKGIPDLLILEPRKGYSGLFIELKLNRSKVYKKNGEIKADKSGHLENQLEILNRLKEKGYYTCFGLGYSSTLDIIRDYLT